MEKITMKDFEERIAKDEALTAKAKELTGEGDALNEKISAFAASLGYELDFGGEPEENDSKRQEISIEMLEKVVGGGPQDQSMSPAKQKKVICKRKGHDWALVKREKGIFWGYNAYYQCNRCGAQRKEWE